MVDLSQHRRLPFWVVRKFLRVRPELAHHMDDLNSEALLGLVEAGRRFEDNGSSSFAHFAISHIRGRVWSYAVTYTGPVTRHRRARWKAEATDLGEVLQLAAPAVDVDEQLDAAALAHRVEFELLWRLGALEPWHEGRARPKFERNVRAFLRLLTEGGYGAIARIREEWGVANDSTVTRALRPVQQVFCEWAEELREEAARSDPH